MNGRKRPSDALTFRKIDQANSDDLTYLADERFDAITEKVIAFMDKTEPEEWNAAQWGLFKLLWQDRKTKKRSPTKTTSGMSMEELETLMSSGGA